MIVALYILIAIVGVGLILYAHERLRHGHDGPPATDEPAPQTQDSDECCGMHITCERDSLLAALSDDIVYFDDEELDQYAGRPADAYSDSEIEQFRDVLLTLLPHDIAPWARSIQLRGIELPAEVKEELLMIVAEERAKRNNPDYA